MLNRKKVDYTIYDVYCKLISGEIYQFVSIAYCYIKSTNCFTLENGLSIAIPENVVDEIKKIKK